MDDNLDLLDITNDSLSDNDTSLTSEPKDSTHSVNVDLVNGWPYNGDDFLIIHYNVNSITSENRLDEITEIVKTTKCSVLVCTESKLDQNIPTNLIPIPGFHEPIRRDRNRHGGGCLIYVANTFTFKHRTELQSDKYEHISIDVRVSEKMLLFFL